MRRNIVIPVECDSCAEFDSVFFALVGALEDRLKTGDERGELMARTMLGARHPSGGILAFVEVRP